MRNNNQQENGNGGGRVRTRGGGSRIIPRASSLGPKFPTRTPNFPGYAEHSITAISPTARPPLSLASLAPLFNIPSLLNTLHQYAVQHRAHPGPRHQKSVAATASAPAHLQLILTSHSVPVVQGGMQWVGYAELASAVSNAGGLGIVRYPLPMIKHSAAALLTRRS
jgi:hypothetical protein